VNIIVEIDGVLRTEDETPIATGVLMCGTLTVYNRMTFLSSTSTAETERWMNQNKVVDYDLVLDNSVGLADEDLVQRQLNVVRSRGSIDLFITANPDHWVYAFNHGIPAVMFGVPAYQRVEFRPDAPKRVRSWDNIVEAVAKQNELRTKDARLSRTEATNFE
jgi:hypothetical protein